MMGNNSRYSKLQNGREGEHDNFGKALKYEKSRQNEADAFYIEKYKPKEIIRWDYNTPEGRDMQIKDIDVTLVLEDGFRLNISEKFRKYDVGDILFEIESNGRPGWTLTSEADRIYYFLGEQEHVRSISVADAKKVVDTAMIVYKDEINEFKKSGKRYASPNSHLGLIASFSNMHGHTWTGYCICMTPEHIHTCYDIEVREERKEKPEDLLF